MGRSRGSEKQTNLAEGKKTTKHIDREGRKQQETKLAGRGRTTKKK